MDAATLNDIGKYAEKLDNALFMSRSVTNDKINVEGLSGTMFEVRDQLIETYVDNGGDRDELDIQAEE
jgi:hypothetical protein